MFSSGLVLEGGGLRAAYESGVTDAFIENNITFPYVIAFLREAVTEYRLLQRICTE